VRGISILRSLALAAILALWSVTTHAQVLKYDIRGVDGLLLANVERHVSAFRLAANSGRANVRAEKAAADAENRVRAALRPYGYYHPTITTQLNSMSGDEWTLIITIDAGPPVLVSNVTVDIEGPGENFKPLVEWEAAWPLLSGTILDQQRWEEHKRNAKEIAASQGYLQAKFSQQSIALDLENNSAELTLIFDTGARSVMGEIKYDQEVLKPYVLDNIPRFRSGEPYTAYLMEKFRIDLWKTGYFTAVEVLEKTRADVQPPVVDLHVTLETETRNTYQGSVGFGTDTDIRLQARWSRHPVSTYGDRLDVAVGWQQFNNEFLLRPIYRIPRRTAIRQYWTTELLFKTEQNEFDFKVSPEDEDAIRLAEGRINDVMFRGGRLKVHNLKDSGDQGFETLFLQYLVETKQLDLIPGLAPGPVLGALDSGFEGRIKGTTKSLSFGIDWDRPSVRGKGFETIGRRDRAWAFGSSEVWGSELNFLQIYAATHYNNIIGSRWKVLLRAEAGYSDAKVDKFTVEIDGLPRTLEVTGLPDLYRFKAGGSKSVRGYGFEDLSTYDLGSNNIVTASAELEMKFLDSWSIAAFFDIGNAFNDWSDPELKKGAGLGIRWYSIAGPIRVDVARALDFEGKPWRLHFTIGTPLL
jgi:translocation and assembly module TamA